jgi:hypothetical protein
MRAWGSAIDPAAGVVFEVFALHSDGSAQSDGSRSTPSDPGAISL